MDLGVLSFCLFAGGGITLGTASGLIPGLHANNFALLLAATAASIPGDPLLIGVAMLTAGVVHTFLDIVPMLTLGVPDAAMAISALPGHRLVLEGRGREALRLSAVGSGLAVVIALPLAVPITWAMTHSYPVIRANLWIVLSAVVCLLVVTESTPEAMVGGLLSFALAAALGWVTLNVTPNAPLAAGSMLTPLLTGLFGAPILLDAMGGGGVPPQADAKLTMGRRDLGLTAGAGSIAGAIVGYLPGISAAIASVLALPAVPNRDPDRGFIVATSGANTANTVFALFALVALGTPRTGVMVAVDETNVPLDIPVLLAAVVVGAACGTLLVVAVGDQYLQTVGQMDYTSVSLVVLAFLGVLAFAFTGWFGVLVFGVSTVIGLVPPRFDARRVHLMGVLIGPLLI
ncbi:putative membrane protein [Halohasta litchfieldiae]|jgi:putative membrane protein|uniref:Putative membrane protein n=1 Tax=Halohasta litchfieldiae TaxID=1073996 RepID=A0A1H6T2X4_9EURY|nr:tripartite tricarboxylate transporter permease [Halohasta litchfieldiae]ATW86930.1 putative membrane protein [Halohasta litchfieldiae]SEI70620.1 putative membrane protein [Halohasta litchfieldiae]